MRRVVLFPYLILDSRAVVGAWELIPRRDFKVDDATNTTVRDAALAHLALYELPRHNGASGCLVRPPAGKIGDEFAPDALRHLRLSVLGGLLDQNLDFDTKHTKQANAALSTSDNAAIYAHPLTEDGEVTVDYGFMVRTLQGGIRAGCDDGKIPPPVELHVPLFRCAFDAQYADALYTLPGGAPDLARRVTTTLDWLGIAWSNTQSIDLDARIVALRCAFEALLGVGEKVGPGRDALRKVLGDKSKGTPRSWTTLDGKPQTGNMLLSGGLRISYFCATRSSTARPSRQRTTNSTERRIFGRQRRISVAP